MGQGVKLSVEQLVELTKEVESEDPIDWGMLNISEEEAIKLIAIDVLDMFEKIKPGPEKEIILISTVTKLVLENFALNLKLQRK